MDGRTSAGDGAPRNPAVAASALGVAGTAPDGAAGRGGGARMRRLLGGPWNGDTLVVGRAGRTAVAVCFAAVSPLQGTGWPRRSPGPAKEV